MEAEQFRVASLTEVEAGDGDDRKKGSDRSKKRKMVAGRGDE